MSTKSSSQGPVIFPGVDIRRTERPNLQDETFHWEGDSLIYIGQERIRMAKALGQLPPSLQKSFKQHLISFTRQGEYASRSYLTLFKVLNSTLNAFPTNRFDSGWIMQAQTHKTFKNCRRIVTRFFLYWRERDSTAIDQSCLRVLGDTVSNRPRQLNVLSDDPEKSWLTDEEYDVLLSAAWDNYDRRASCTQVTLIKLLSMQYSRRAVQIARLKICDIHESDSVNSSGLTGRVINFPGAKDKNCESDFRDSKVESHPLPDHLWNLCLVQLNEVRALYEYTLGVTLTDDQFKQLPLFCCESRIRQARQIIEARFELDLLDNLDNKLFHLHELMISKILRWAENTPTCAYGEEVSRRRRPKPPASPRTSRKIVVTATRMRHTRARQLARLGVPRHILSHWLGHTFEHSLDSYYNDPAEQARQLDEAMAPVLIPLAMAFTGKLIDAEDQATRVGDPTSELEFSREGELKSVGRCGKFSFCATTSVPIPCYRCRYFEPLVDAPHQEVLSALLQRQSAEEQSLKIGGLRNLLIPIDLSADIRAVENCIARCNVRKAERKIIP